MNLTETVLILCIMAILGLLVYIYLLKRTCSTPSIESGLKSLKHNLIKVILFYQKEYSDSDQLVLVKMWIENNIDVKELAPGQLELFKEFIKKL